MTANDVRDPRRALLVGIDDAPPVPMQQGTPEGGDFRGYEVDLLAALAARIGAALRFRRAYWSAIVADLAAGRVDAVCSAATVTPERAREVDFCRPHLHLTLAVVTRAGDPAGTALAGRRVGVRAGTTAEAYARAHGAPQPAAVSESNDALYAALAAGALDAVVDDSPIAAHFAGAAPGLAVAGALPDTEAAYAIMVRQGDDALRGSLDAALEALESDGTLHALRVRWGLDR
ncbi:ABC transporter substrate-binding protein [Roseisolibacter sp. H3M3-2]|uniref:ABC transporter substrate-binding protein n=1 Tax=Roseisolibacter sp. H3M3-2 TaxID=3031323 RepID=UPI0023DAEAC2|nr:ABC transporter substrate-binding protein [Roseisolibacter sp. H3M3-2]MDF1503622.1 ABC transporter substrate-binding protein [Roseisolibacter sp. H3M3-2]